MKSSETIDKQSVWSLQFPYFDNNEATRSLGSWIYCGVLGDCGDTYCGTTLHGTSGTPQHSVASCFPCGLGCCSHLSSCGLYSLGTRFMGCFCGRTVMKFIDVPLLNILELLWKSPWCELWLLCVLIKNIRII